MKRLIIKIILLPLLALAMPAIILLTISPQYTHEYTASFIDKMERLEKIKEPKIILVGNSNLSYGIESEIIQNAIGMPVVNLGLHGGLGNAFHERMPLFNMTRGDIIVISHLDYSDDDSIHDAELALLTVENYFHYWKIFRPKDYPKIICTLPKYTYKCLLRFLLKADKEPKTPTCYARSSFNKYGDNVFPRDIEAGESAPYLREPAINKTCVDRINRLYEFCKSNGVSLVVAGAPILSGLPNFEVEKFKLFQKELKKDLRCPIISDFTDYIFDKKYFFAGALHLTNQGAKLRTEQLAKDLKNFLIAIPD
ncbi:MAG: hypothetical protein K6A42_03670 [Treponema sp.]|nr:hypothetical protein [Treponema sp.]